MDARIRKFQKDDIEIIVNFREALACSLGAINPQRLPTPRKGIRQSYKELITQKVKDEKGKIYIAELEGTIVGYVFGYVKKQSSEDLLEFLQEQEGEIVDLYVDEPFRGKGIGVKLIEAMEKYFKEAGCDYSLIEVLMENKGIDLYKRQGYKPREVLLLKSLRSDTL